MKETERRRLADEVFEAALDVPAEDRARFLEQACSGDAALRAEVEELLAAHEVPAGILEAKVPAAARPPSEEGRRIGPYAVRRELGRGGMGVVYLAERDDGQFRRRVAIKLLRASPDAEELRGRFMAERQILASLDHPNIAQLLDAGVTDGQLPYLVMEYVEGLPVTTYCDRNRLGVKARLQLFESVCAAVHHAHRNLVIHRDLKPSNILVTDSGQVKLLDFGIAKLQNPALSGLPAPVTRPDVRVLTPEYASPEQLRGEPLSTASDIYALGVVLYELLAGCRPHEATQVGTAELAGRIGEREPVRPSTAVARHRGVANAEASDTKNEAATPEAVAAARDTTPERLRRQLQGDLDAIVMMALRAEPVRRYGSADLLAEDIRRHLDGLPVLAHRGSRRYRAGKFLRRRRTAAAVAAVAGLSLFAGAGMAFWQAGLARAERDRAEQARVRAEQALRQSEEVTSFLVGLFEAGDPTSSAGDLVTARDLLRRGMAQIEALSDQPLVQARMLEAVGRVYRTMGRQTDARSAVERALALRQATPGADPLETVTTLQLFADILRRQGRYPEAEARAHEALRIQEQTLGADDPALAATLTLLSGLAVYRGDLRTALTLAWDAQRFHDADPAADDTAVIASLIHLASVLRRTGDYQEAEQQLRHTLELAETRFGPAHAIRAEPMRHLAYLAGSQDRLDDAERLLRDVLEIRRRTVGPAHPTYAWVLGDLAGILSRKGDHDAAIELYREEVTVLRRVYGVDYDDAGMVIGALAMALARAGRLDEAEAAAREGLELARRDVGEEHQVFAEQLMNLADVLRRKRRFEEAEAMYRRAIAIRSKANGPITRNVGFMRGALGAMLIEQQRFPEAEAELLAAVSIVEATELPDVDPEFQEVLRSVVDLYDAWDRPQEAARFRPRLRGR